MSEPDPPTTSSDGRSGRLDRALLLAAVGLGVAGAVSAIFYEHRPLAALASIGTVVAAVAAIWMRRLTAESTVELPPGALETDVEIAHVVARTMSDGDAYSMRLYIDNPLLFSRLHPTMQVGLVEKYIAVEPDAGPELEETGRPEVRWLVAHHRVGGFDADGLTALAAHDDRALRSLALREATRRGGEIAQQVAAAALGPGAESSAVPTPLIAELGADGPAFADPEAFALDWLAEHGDPSRLEALRRARARRHLAAPAQRAIERIAAAHGLDLEAGQMAISQGDEAAGALSAAERGGLTER